MKKFTCRQFELFVGVIFLVPPICSAILFIIGMFVKSASVNRFVHYVLSYNYSGSGSHYTDQRLGLIYLGLMAIAGAYLVKEKK